MTQVNFKKKKSKSIMLFLEINLWFSKIDEILAQMSSIFSLNLDKIMYKVFFFCWIFEVTRDSDSILGTRTRTQTRGLRTRLQV